MNFVRRSLGALIGFAPVGLAVASLAFLPRRATILGLLEVVIAALVACFNFQLSFVRRWQYRSRYSSAGPMPHVSGIPVVGSFIIMHALIGTLGSRIMAVAALVILAIDTGGLPWTLVMVWKDRSFWEDAV